MTIVKNVPAAFFQLNQAAELTFTVLGRNTLIFEQRVF